MIYCKKCDIYVEKDRSHCPLCGKCVNEENLQKKRKPAFYPDYTRWHRDRANIAALLTIILIAMNAVWIFLEFVIFRRLHITWFFLSGSGVAFLMLIWPFAKSQSFSMRNIIGTPTICLFLYFLEAYTRTLGWGIGIVIPLFLLGNALSVMTVMLTRGYYLKSTMFPCLFTGIFSVAVFCINAFTIYKSGLGLWPSVTALATAWGCFVILFGVRYRKIVNGLKKDFHI